MSGVIGFTLRRGTLKAPVMTLVSAMKRPADENSLQRNWVTFLKGPSIFTRNFMVSVMLLQSRRQHIHWRLSRRKTKSVRHKTSAET